MPVISEKMNSNSRERSNESHCV